jgi:flagellar motility protein MotE (MotC chaperone)
MKAADAARILSGLDDQTALLVLSRLKAANLGNILGDMQTADAARFTEMLAARANTAAIVGEIAEPPAEDETAGEP